MRSTSDFMPGILLAALALAGSGSGFDAFRGEATEVTAGNEHFQASRYDEALKSYEAAHAPESRAEIEFNRGAALHKLGRFDDAQEAFNRAIDAKDPALKSKAYYNLGNTLVAKKQVQEAISVYRRALQIDPNNGAALHNLGMALAALRQQEQQQKPGGEGDKDDKDKPDEKDKGDKDDQKKDKDKAQDQEGDKDKKDGEKDKDSGKEDKGKEGESQEDQQGKQQDQRAQAGQDGAKDQKPEPQPGQEEKPQDQNQQQTADAKAAQEQDAKQGQDQAGQAQPGKEDEAKPVSPESLKQAMRVLDTMQRQEQALQSQRFMLKKFQPRYVDKDW